MLGTQALWMVASGHTQPRPTSGGFENQSLRVPTEGSAVRYCTIVMLETLLKLIVLLLRNGMIRG